MKPNLSRDACLAEANSILSRPNLTKADSARCDGLLKLAEQLSAGSTELRKLRLAKHAYDAGIADPTLAPYIRKHVANVCALDEIETLFNVALRSGRDAIEPETRALAVGSGGAGGYLVPQSFSDRLWATLKAYDPLFDANIVTVIPSTSGSAMPHPIIDDGSGAAVIVPENNQIAEVELAFAQAQIPSADKWSAPIIRVSRELVEDSAFDLQTFLADVFAARFARGIGAAMVSSILTAASLGVQLPSGNTTSVTFDGIVDLMASVDPAYIATPKAAFAMRFATLAALFKLKASSGGSPMLPLSYDGGRFRLFGFPILIAPSVPAIAASAKTIVFGDFGHWAVRQVTDGISVRPYFERYAEFGQVGYSAQMRVSSCLIKAAGADSPLKYHQQSAS